MLRPLSGWQTPLAWAVALTVLGAAGCNHTDTPSPSGQPEASATPDAPVTSSAGGGEPPAAAIQFLEGLVTSAKGDPIAGVAIEPLPLDGQPVRDMGSFTDENGRYSWPLYPGRYEVSARLDGYKTATKQVVVGRGDPTRLDFILEPGP
jgi:hypothetical protein